MRIVSFLLRAKDEWFNKSNVPLSAQEIDRLLKTAYTGAGIDVLTSGAALKNEATGWVVGVDDVDSNVYHWFKAYKATPFGKKMIYSGHDGKQESIAEMKLVTKRLISDPGNHFYGEVSGAWGAIMRRWKIPEVPFEDVQKILSDKQLEPVEGNPNAYRRTLGGAVREKVMHGYPIVSKTATEVTAVLEDWLG